MLDEKSKYSTQPWLLEAPIAGNSPTIITAMLSKAEKIKPHHAASYIDRYFPAENLYSIIHKKEGE